MTYVEDGVIHIGEMELKWLLVQYIKEYKFTHKNEKPAKLILPPIKEVDGVPVEIDYASLIRDGKPEEEKVMKREVSHAITS